MTDTLGPLAEPTVWPATSGPIYGRSSRSLASLVARQWDINKIAHYLPVYERAFGRQMAKKQQVRLLEIGVSFGGSLELWRAYFSRADVVVGIDANPNCAQFDNPERNTHVRIGAQQDTEFLASVVKEFGPFDIILDDGSHIPSYTLQSFQYLFLNGLADGGVYMVEDLHTCYSDDCPSPEQDDGTPQFVDVVKHLIDVMHAHYRQTPTGDEFSDSFEPGNPGYRSEFTVPLATTLISSIEIHDAIVAIHKGRRELPRMIRRWSRERMTSVLNEDAALFLDDHPHLGEADRTRTDWLTQ